MILTWRLYLPGSIVFGRFRFCAMKKSWRWLKATSVTKTSRFCLGSAVGGILVLGLLGGAVYALTYHPAPVEPVPVVGSAQAPVLRAGQKLRILSWNVQYLAGKNQLFWYETTAGYQGPVADRPSPEDLAQTLSEVARIITNEKPDIVLLQELDDGSKRTDYADQLSLLLERLPQDYSIVIALSK